jgi:hypothetical protein
MAEQYKLYMKRNVFNGRYFVRNMQIVFCAVIVIALLIGIILLSGSKTDVKNTVDAKKIDVKEALLGNNDVTEAELAAKEDEEVADAKEESTTEASTEAVAVMSEITAAADDNTGSPPPALSCPLPVSACSPQMQRQRMPHCACSLRTDSLSLPCVPGRASSPHS